ncbi:hypothetical protein RJT34_29938 [Clitoria ternatea]|uniref:Uncharacterized protein n=1 Tax=Clitoria ternatea TaxID=43366 RepID=A0AAN9ESI8_CLITE
MGWGRLAKRECLETLTRPAPPWVAKLAGWPTNIEKILGYSYFCAGVVLPVLVNGYETHIQSLRCFNIDRYQQKIISDVQVS